MFGPKVCSHCRIAKPRSEFHKQSARPDGLHPQCKACRSALDSAARSVRDGTRNERLRLFAEGKRRCVACKAIKPLVDFYRQAKRRDGYASRCVPCYADYTAEYSRRPSTKALRSEQHKRLKERDPVAWHRTMRNGRLRRKYGITLAGYEGMLHAQGGRCGLCGERPLEGVDLAVDHDHETGQVRALLHHKCNSGLGMFDDDLERLEMAAAYLRRFQGPNRPWTLGPHPFDRLDSQNVLSAASASASIQESSP